MAKTIHFPNTNKARVIEVAPGPIMQPALAALQLSPPRAVLVLNGGTADLSPDLRDQLGHVLGDGLARVAAEEEITLVTGGTDAGVFHLLGKGLATWGRTAPCIGVAVAGLVSFPGHAQGEAALEPHHSHFVLVEGEHWGDETVTMYSLIDVLTQAVPSLAVFAGGGEICIGEMQANVAQNRQMILLAGSGRSTDGVLAAMTGNSVDDGRLVEIARRGQIVPFDVAHDPAGLRDLVRHLLFDPKEAHL